MASGSVSCRTVGGRVVVGGDSVDHSGPVARIPSGLGIGITMFPVYPIT